MTTLRVQVSLKSTTQISRDTVVNTFHIGTGTAVPGGTETTAILNAFKTLYQSYLMTYFSSIISLSNHEIRIYDLGEPPKRVPIDQTTFTFSSVGTDTLPLEVALCVSMRGTYISGTPDARRRGRVYMGPWKSATATTSTGRPSAALQAALVSGFSALRTAIAAVGASYYLGVWSPTTGEVVPVISGWVDDEWDTQRRRGRDATGRTVWS